MFWGLIMEPNKRYTQVVAKPFHISQAAMDISTGDNDPCQVMVVVEGKNFLVCTLQKNKNIQVSLDLYFKSGDAISFLTNGKCNVHLTGYLDPEFEDEEASEGDEEEDEDEAPTLVSAAKRKLENSNEKNAKKQKKDKKAAQADSSDSDDESEDQLQKILDGEDLDTDDNDESFKLNTTAEDSDGDEEESDDEEEAEEEEGEEEEEDESSEEAETTLDTSKEEEAKVDISKLSKSARRRLKKKLQKEGKEPQVNGVDKPKKDAKGEQKQKEKKPEAKKEVQQNGQVEKKEKKTISGGVAIEDLKVGNGPVAKPGKNVMVYYEGRLKSNNKMFDNCLKGPGFKFRLGAKEVISGWDVGVSGMRVGGKRRITCPPNMAYGAKGSPPVIPPNSTLVFEVELKNVK
ncbi:46 kDa FK506-binding nuclear protein-like [Cydia pomonella]|uniref:46 kDa FK506-binding nuclear protein-like n=1 Tax=Cydia pomonella TaxID=82600 RepID=UPI002ADDFE11|nr:46 kDa FK506-binding nuclear protein-like [Cydia pomonella]